MAGIARLSRRTMSDGSLSSMHSPTDETVINLAERLTVRGRRAAEARFSLCLGRCSVSVRNLSDFRPKGATDEVLRRDTGYHTCPLGADIAAAARIPFTAHRTSRSNSAGHAANTTFCRLWPLIW
jgi:hypothetical protein